MIFIFLKGRRLSFMQKDITSATEYKIGNTTYIVNVKFAPNCKENISDVVRRLI
nr:transposon-encoded TnpW family protein [Lachnospiraceae bacterium]